MPLDDNDDFKIPEREPEAKGETLLQAHWGKLLLAILVVAAVVLYRWWTTSPE